MLKALFTILLTVPSALMGGLVFSKMWNWFLVRLFPTAPHLGVLDSVGLLMVLGFPLLSLAVRDAKEEIKKKHPDMSSEAIAIAWSIVMTLLVYPLCLFFAWIWHLVIGG